MKKQIWAERKEKKRDRMHIRQIPTTMYAIKKTLWECGHHTIYALLHCFISEPGSAEQKNDMVAAAVWLEKISCLVYPDKNGYFKKLPVERYYKEIFEAFAETPEEVYDRIERYGATREQAEHIFKLVWQVADLVCPMIAHRSEQPFIGELAYAIEYVVKHDGDLPKPEIGYFFPKNYPDFDYGSGIAAEIEPYLCR